MLCVQAEASYPETREHLLGDIDNCHYDGPGSVDDVYVDPNFMDQLNPSYANGAQPFDSVLADQSIPFTFAFELAQGEQVVGASLSLGLMGTTGSVHNDRIRLDMLSPIPNSANHSGIGAIGEPWYDFADLGWLPLPTAQSAVRTLDIGNVLGDDWLSCLQDGQLDVDIDDDTAVDYATLTIEVVPEPTTLSLLVLGVLAVLRHKRKKHALTWGEGGLRRPSLKGAVVVC